MPHSERRTLLKAIAAAPLAGVAVSPPAAAEQGQADPSWRRLYADWRQADAHYQAICAEQDALADDATPAGQTLYARATEAARACVMLEQEATAKPARDWAALTLKLEMIGRGNGLDAFCEQGGDALWTQLVSEVLALRGT